MAASVAVAQSPPMSKGQMMEHGRAHHMQMGGWGFHSKKLRSLLKRAESLKLDDSQKAKIISIRDKFLFPIIKREADLKIAHIKAMDEFRNPDFDPTKLKAGIKAANSIHLDICSTSVDAMAELRDAIGKANYKKLLSGGGGMPGAKGATEGRSM